MGVKKVNASYNERRNIAGNFPELEIQELLILGCRHSAVTGHELSHMLCNGLSPFHSHDARLRWSAHTSLQFLTTAR